MKTIKTILYFLSNYEKKITFGLLILVIIMAVLEMIGVASIMPFIALVSKPSIIETNYYFKYLFNFFEFEKHENFLFLIGILVFFIFLFSTIFKAFTTSLMLRYSRFREYSITNKLVKAYLNQKYDFFLEKNSSDLTKMILSEVGQIVGGVIIPIIEIFTQFFIIAAIITLLIIVNPSITIIGGLSLSFLYLLIYLFFKKKLSYLAIQRKQANQIRFRALLETFRAIKIIKLLGIENYYSKIFKNAAYNYAKSQSSANILAQIPKYFIEIIAFGGLLILILILLKTHGNIQTILPTLSLFAFAGYKLIPGINGIYNNLVALKFSESILEQLFYESKQLTNEIKKPYTKSKILFNKNIEFKNVYYKYPQSEDFIIKNINFKINRNSVIGFVGTTGAGKSTIIDIIAGLLQPSNGKVYVDDLEINQNNLRAWQDLIGYVPQEVVLSDDDIKSNIAFGKNKDQIDLKKLDYVTKIASINDFVNFELAQKFDTFVGEQGIKLSGGQRQRLGIARALYSDPKLLILDEATSSLDNLNEENIIKSLRQISKNLTIIIIAHRLTTVKECDLIHFVKDGTIVDSGNFEELVNLNKDFKKMSKNLIKGNN